MTTVEDIADFFARRMPHLAAWDRDKFVAVLRWFRKHDLLRATLDTHGRITAAAAFRRIRADDPAAERRLCHDERADTLWIDWAAADSPAARADCTLAVVRRFADAPLHVHALRCRRGMRPLRLSLRRSARIFLQP